MKGLCYRVGQGNKINIWEDPWIPDSSDFKPSPINEGMLLRQGMVQSLKNEFGEWNITLLNELFNRQSIKNICTMFWENNDEDGMIIWVGDKNGEFFVKFFYWLENWELLFCGGVNCGIAKFMKGKNFLFGRLLTEGLVSNLIWLEDLFPSMTQHVCMVVAAWKMRYTYFLLVNLLPHGAFDGGINLVMS